MIDFIFNIGVPTIDLILLTHYDLYIIQCHNEIYRTYEESELETKRIYRTLSDFFGRDELVPKIQNPIIVTSKQPADLEKEENDLIIEVMNFDQFKENMIKISEQEK